MAARFRLSSLKGRFAKLDQVGAWIFGIVGVFLLPPPVGSDGDIIEALAKFVAVVATGLVLVRVRRWNRRRAWIVATASLVLSVSAFFAYRYFVASWTCTYFDVPMVVGDDENLTSLARQHLAQNPNLPCELLLQDFGGQTELVWARGVLIARRFALAGAYLLCLPLLIVCLIALLQATGERRRTKAAG
ncbi:MAG: hypothetical protein HYY76_07175 [Acidobacteria bacterium]|nr:hypothetical protein [Acidobacteriota bacterium]